MSQKLYGGNHVETKPGSAVLIASYVVDLLVRQRRWRPPTAQMTKTRKSFMLSAGLSTNDLAVRALQQDRDAS